MKSTEQRGNIYLVGETVFDILMNNNGIIRGVSGGAMLNSSVTIANQGNAPFLLTEMGNDNAGSFVWDFLIKNGVDLSYASREKDIRTTISLAMLDADNNAQYNFYKFPLKHSYLHKKLKSINFTSKDMLMLGSFFVLDPRNRDFIFELAEKARQSAMLIFYDPNIRLHHLENEETIIISLFELFVDAHIIRLSFEDLQNIIFYLAKYEEKKGGIPDELKVNPLFQLIRKILPGENLPLIKKTSRFFTDELKQTCIREFNRTFHDKILIFTDEKNPVHLIYGKIKITLDIPGISPVSTIGAGDTFNAVFCDSLCLLEKNKAQLLDFLKKEPEILKQCLKKAILGSQEVCLSEFNYLMRRI